MPASNHPLSPSDAMPGERNARATRFAFFCLFAAILGAITFFLLIPAFIALILAIIAIVRAARNPARIADSKIAGWAATISICALCGGALTLLLLPSHGCARCITSRAYCAASLRGIEQNLIVYSSTHDDKYPIVHYAPYSRALNSPTADADETTAAATLNAYDKPPFPQAGSVTASLWILVLADQITPKQFICPTDPNAKAPALRQSPTGNFYDNFQADTQISYSAAYPWMADGTVGKWWTSTTDPSLPVLADMAPEQGTGTPPRDLLSPTAPPKARNTGNHGGEGQNVVFADNHVEFLRRPDVGQAGDNIWTPSASISKGPASSGVLAGPWPPQLTATKPPFDTVMYPIRNLTTGHL